MLTVQDVADTNIVEIVVDGRISAEQFKHATALMDQKIQAYGSVSVLEHIQRLRMPELAMVWDDLKWGLIHIRHLDRVAVISDQGWLRTATKAWKPIMGERIRAFPSSQIEQARQWLRTERPSKQAG
jgi:hypothetical protein